MKGRILFVVGVGVGYVLGTRAGRERYEQIKSAAASVWNTPTVQKGVDSAKDFALARVGSVSDTVLDNVKSLIGNATKASGASKHDVRSTARSAKDGVSKAASAARDAVDEAASKIDDVIDVAAEAAEAAAAAEPTPESVRKPAAKPRSAKPTS